MSQGMNHGEMLEYRGTGMMLEGYAVEELEVEEIDLD